MTIAPFLAGVAVGLFIAGLIALHVWSRRHPMTPQERQEIEDEMRIW